MAWRVAISSLDGVLINEHFGRAKWFYIVDVEADGTGTVVERRMTAPLCQEGGHTEAGAASRIDALRDCTAVLTAKIGPGARQRLEAAGLSVFEQPAVMEDAVKKLAAYYSSKKSGPF